MQEIFPISRQMPYYSIALPDKGYFILNDSILDHEFEPEFSQMLINIWLSPESNFIKLQPQLLGEEKDQPHRTSLKPNRKLTQWVKMMPALNYHRISH